MTKIDQIKRKWSYENSLKQALHCIFKKNVFNEPLLSALKHR